MCFVFWSMAFILLVNIHETSPDHHPLAIGPRSPQNDFQIKTKNTRRQHRMQCNSDCYAAQRIMILWIFVTDMYKIKPTQQNMRKPKTDWTHYCVNCTIHHFVNNVKIKPVDAKQTTETKCIILLLCYPFMFSLFTVRKDLSQRLQFRFFQNIHRKQATMIQWTKNVRERLGNGSTEVTLLLFPPLSLGQ